jgi:hypothetical protein
MRNFVGRQTPGPTGRPILTFSRPFLGVYISTVKREIKRIASEFIASAISGAPHPEKYYSRPHSPTPVAIEGRLGDAAFDQPPR